MIKILGIINYIMVDDEIINVKYLTRVCIL